jgi:TolB-like protein/Tfp pilus assembly protein PilF
LPTATDSQTLRGVFACEGEFWTLAYRNHLVRLADSKGLGQIAYLLRNPGRQILALDLIAATDSPLRQGRPSQASDFTIPTSLPSDTGELLDAKARTAYAARIKELREELDQARRRGFESRAIAAEAEIDALTAHLKSSLGIGGRARKSGSAAERARLAVSKSIGRAIESIAAANPELGRLLETTIKTGTFCRYQPDPRFPVEWNLDASGDAIATLPMGTRLSDLFSTSETGAAVTPSHPPQSTPITPRKIAAGAALCILAIVVTTAFAYRTRIINAIRPPPPAVEPISPTVAVLPFANLSASKDDEYFSDGMTDEIIGDLSKIRGLRVTGRSSSFMFKGRNEPSDKIADRLHVGHLLEGSVSRSTNRLRIEVELIDAGNGFTIWSERYDRDTADVFAIQSDVAESVADKLRVSLLPQDSARVNRKPTDNPEAYDLYLRGRYFHGLFSEEGDLKAIDCLTRAIALDPNFALAHAALASVYSNSTDWYFAPREAEPIVKTESERALALDDRLAEPHSTLGFYHFQYEWNWPAAEREFRRGIEVAPDDWLPHGFYGFALGAMGRYDDALRELHRAFELDPLNPLQPVWIGEVYAKRRDYVRARQCYQRVIDLAPGAWVGYFDRGSLSSLEGNWPAAIGDLEKSASLTDNPMVKGILGATYAQAGRKTDALKVLAELQETSKHRFVSPFFFMCIYGALGNQQQTIRYADEAYQGRCTFLTGLRDPGWDKARSQPGFQALEKNIGLYQ